MVPRPPLLKLSLQLHVQRPSAHKRMRKAIGTQAHATHLRQLSSASLVISMSARAQKAPTSVTFTPTSAGCRSQMASDPEFAATGSYDTERRQRTSLSASPLVHSPAQPHNLHSEQPATPRRRNPHLQRRRASPYASLYATAGQAACLAGTHGPPAARKRVLHIPPPTSTSVTTSFPATKHSAQCAQACGSPANGPSEAP